MKLTEAEKQKLDPMVAHALEHLNSLPLIAERIQFGDTQVSEMLRFIERILPDLVENDVGHLLQESQLCARKGISPLRAQLLSRIRIEIAIRNIENSQPTDPESNHAARGPRLTREEIRWVAEEFDRDLQDHPDDSIPVRHQRLADKASQTFKYDWKPRRVKQAREKRPRR